MNILLIFFGAFGAISYVLGTWIVNRLNGSGGKISQSDFLAFVFFCAVSAFYTGMIFADKSGTVKASFVSFFNSTSISWGDAIAAWSVGSTFAVTMHSIGGKPKRNIDDGADLISEDITVEDVKMNVVRRVTRKLTNFINKRI